MYGQYFITKVSPEKGVLCTCGFALKAISVRAKQRAKQRGNAKQDQNLLLWFAWDAALL